ncbi:MAG: LEPR-XLL domain-containing protein, partial [Planctomycetia bacterium]|nr:LEPR-XLL domain-containing protein [Planctomycetia bacterium]
MSQRSRYCLSRPSRRKRMVRKCVEQLEPRLMLAADWQNPSQPLDVNNDLAISPLDALVGINRLNARGGGPLGVRDPNIDVFFYDSTGDGSHSPLDVLLVVNVLNENRPVVVARLVNDTAPDGSTNSDRLTNDPRVRLISAVGGAAFLRAGVDDGAGAVLVELSAAAQSQFELDRGQLELLRGAALADGSHTLRIQAAR